MTLFPFKTLPLLRWLFPHFIWKMPHDLPTIYLTFDDGPIPDVTEWVLQELAVRNIPATFFCVGDNIRKYPEVFSQILAGGHRVGNHTYHHLSGWRQSTAYYLENVRLCETEMSNFQEFNAQVATQPRLFRPPYGRIKKSQSVQLRAQGYQIIMWDVLSGDFAKEISAAYCLQKTTQYSRAGSIVVFHDSLKTEKKLREVLPSFLDALLAAGFSFQTL